MFAPEVDGGLWSGESDQLSDDEIYDLTVLDRGTGRDEPSVIPAGLDQMAPGPELGAILSAIDREKLSGYDLVVFLRARQRQINHDQAQLYADMAEVAHRADPSHQRSIEILEYASDEIRAALNLTRKAAEADLSFAIEIRERLPRVWDVMSSGELDLRRARTIWHQTRHLSQTEARRVVDAIIDTAPELTSGQLRVRIQKLCINLDPDEAKTRYESSVEERRVHSEANPEGTANVYGTNMAPHLVGRAMRRINRIAKGLKAAGDDRTLDQIRADVFLDLLNGKDHRDTAGGVVIRVDLATLVELDNKAGEIPGYGPVIADIARQVGAEQINGEWRWTVCHPDTGAILADGTTRRRPTAAQRRHVEARDETCIFPGCLMPATDCDLDHTEEWHDGGQTLVDNTPPACKHDHMVRHNGGWRYRRLPDGRFEWISRLGHRYTNKPRAP